MKNRKVIGGSLLTLFILCFLGFVIYFGGLTLFAFSPANSAATSQNDVIIEVHKRESAWEISRLLEKKGAVTSASSFHRLGRLTRQWQKIKTGEYRVNPNMNPIQVFAVITSGISLSHPITIREGENMYEIADALDARGLVARSAFLELAQNPKMIRTHIADKESPETDRIPSLEGYLFPDTYFFNKTMSPEDMIRQMTKRFHAIWTGAQDARAKEIGMTRHQVVTLASIVEKETGAPHERPMISSVFHNRLAKRMKLQSDPTTIYGIWESWGGNLRKSDLLAHTPYNTYAINALPPGPISNPGKDAIQAALYPEKSEFLYFVSHNDGTHEFTKTYEDHSKAVREFQMNRKARQGKSWRDLNKKPGS